MSNGQVSHPELATLTAFAVGDLSENEARDVEGHIAECETCCETLLNLENDTFVDLVVRSKDVQIESHEQTEDIHRSSTTTLDSSDELDLLSELANHPRYRTVELLGRGGMGDVFKAEHRMMERTVALKVIKRELFRNPAAVQRFHREVKSAARLSHPNIVTAHDAEQVGDVNFLVMEYVEGVDLARRVKKEGALPINEACDYILQVALGLQHAHDQGMVHRDIKPHNLMVTGDGTLKILDFGLATLATEAINSEVGDEPSEDVPEKTSTSRLTTMGTMMGTPEFISPEQAGEPHAVDIRSDIYSLGCTFYYLLSGHAPFVAGSVMEKVKAHADQQAEPIENVRADVPSEVADVVRRMMAKDPAERFQTPAEVADALAPFVDAYRSTPTQNGVSIRDGASSGKRPWWPPTIVQSLACAAFAFILGAIIYVATDRGTLEVESDDQSVEITILAADRDPKDADDSRAGMRIVDTITGSSVKWLRSGQYVVDLKGDDNVFELNRDRFVLKRGGRITVKITRKKNEEVASQPHTPSTPVITERQIWTSQRHVGLRSISRNGKYLPFVDWNHLNVGLRDLEAEDQRVFVESNRSAYSDAIPVISPDGKHIVFNKYQDGWEGYHLQICGVDGSQPTDLFGNDEVRWVEPFDWSPDGELILALCSRQDKTQQMVLVSAKDGSARTIKSFDWNGPSNMKFAPDGHSIVYERNVQSDPKRRANHDIFVLMVEQNREISLVQHPADDTLLGSAPDGSTVLFASDRQSGRDAWAIDASGSGEPTLVKKGIGNVDPIGFAGDGSFFYSTSPPTNDVFVVTIDEASRQVILPPKKISRFPEGGNKSPDWSPDGRQLAYVHRGDRVAITIVQCDTENHRRIFPDLAYIRGKGARWSPDGTSFILAGTDNKGRRGIYQVNAESGDTTLVRRGSNGRRVVSPEWTPDGKSILFTEFTQGEGWKNAEVAMRMRDLETEEESEIPGSFVSNVEPSFCLSSDGQHLVYATRLKKTAKLSIVPIKGGQPRVLYETKQRKIGRCTPAGSDVIFEMSHPSEETELWQVSVKDGNARSLGLLANGLSMYGYLHPRISPDGLHIAFNASSVDEDTIQTEVWALKNFLPMLKSAEALTALRAPKNTAPSIEVLETGYGTISPDLTRVLTSQQQQPVIKDRLSGHVTEVSDEFTGRGSSNFAVWSHDSKKIAHVFYTGSEHNERQIRIASALDGTVISLPSFEYKRIDIQDWSPDGKAILCRVRNRDDSFALVKFSVDSGKLRQLRSVGWDFINHARFSPDGRYIAFSKELQENKSKIYIYDTVDNRVSRLTVLMESESNPVWTPDGRHVLYTSAGHLRAVEFTNGQPARNASLVRADWNDFGKRLTSGGELMFRKYSVITHTYFSRISDKSVSPPERITPSRSAFSAAWSPGGKRVVYLAGEELHIVSVEGGRVVERIDPGLSYMLFVHWSPDGKTLAIGPGTGNDPIGVSLYSLETRTSKLLVPFPRAKDGNKTILPKGFTGDGKEFVVDSSVTAGDGVISESLAYNVNDGKARKVDFPDSSPDGNLIARVTKEEALWKLTISDRDFENVTTIAEHQEVSPWKPSITHLRWSPDGKKLSYFVFKPNVGKELHVGSPDGKWQQKLETAKLKHWSRPEVAPVWSPDSSQLTYALTEGPYVETCVLRNYLSQLSEAE